MLCIEFIAKTKPLVFSRNWYQVGIGAKMFIEISPTGVRKQKIILYTSAAQILQGEEPPQLRIQDFPEEGTNPKVGAPTCYLAKFS